MFKHPRPTSDEKKKPPAPGVQILFVELRLHHRIDGHIRAAKNSCKGHESTTGALTNRTSAGPN